MRRQGNPKKFELVVCKIVKIFPNSALAEMIEYRKRGLIHVSEVALRWVKDIREFIKLNQFVVCQVMRVDGQDVSLSVKRVRKPDADRKLSEFKRERKAEKMLELIAKKKKKTLDDAYREVGYVLQEEFGSIHKSFEFAVKNPELLKSKGVSKEWLEPIIEMAKKSYGDKTFEIKAKLKITCAGPEGIMIIKKVLSKAQSDGLDVSYVSAPNYMVIGRGKDVKAVRAKVKETVEKIEKELSGHKGTCEIEISESK